MRVMLVGTGGHGRVVLDAARLQGLSVIVAVDRRPDLWGTQVEGVPVIGDDGAIDRAPTYGITGAIMGVGAVDVTDKRAALFFLVSQAGLELPVVRHPASAVAQTARLGPATVVLARVVVNADSSVGNNVILNSRAVIGPACTIGDHVHIAPGARLGAEVTVGERSHIGIGSRLVDGVRVGTACMIAAGALVVEDVPDGARVAGIPARPR